jgi:2-dehydro-3-deoxyphosphogalactonate aldolase
MMTELPNHPDTLPVIAILRGIRPAEVLAVCEVLITCRIRIIEVPLNSPEPYESIARVVAAFGREALIGSGTVLDVGAVQKLSDIGAKLVVAPNTDPAVIRAARKHAMRVLPGAMTPTELFQAHQAGADGAKLFPASALGLRYVRDVRAVLPVDFPLYAVGGIDASNAMQWMASGVAGLGIGSSIYAPGDTPGDVRAKAEAIAAVFDGAEK